MFTTTQYSRHSVCMSCWIKKLLTYLFTGTCEGSKRLGGEMSSICGYILVHCTDLRSFKH